MSTEVIEIICTAVVSMLVGVVCTQISIRSQWKIAKRSGAFKEHQLSLELFGQHIAPSSGDKLEWCLLHPGQQGDTMVAPLVFYIHNNGDAPCKNPILTIQGPRVCIPVVEQCEYRSNVVPAVMNEEMKRAVAELGEFNQVSYTLPSIAPETKMRLSDSFGFEPSVNQPVDIKGESKDNVKFTATLEINWIYPFLINILTPDSTGLQTSVSLSCVSADDIESAVERYYEARKKRYAQYVNSLSVRKRIQHWFEKRVTKVVVFVHYEVEKEAKVKENKIFRMKTPPLGEMPRIKICRTKLPQRF